MISKSPASPRPARRAATRKKRASSPSRTPQVSSRSLQAPARASQVARVAQHLEHAILAGRFAAGQRLSESELARTLGASRTPIREAM
ncbi:MAG: GntR family transcriptional regulator, partial [Alphaproteobacteria bacterium]